MKKESAGFNGSPGFNGSAGFNGWLLLGLSVWLLGAIPAFAEVNCKGPDIQTLSRPLYPGETGSPSFLLAYQKMAGASSPDKPTIIYIPGGPGGTAIGHGDLFDELNRDGSAVYFFDPRGTGCSQPKGKVEDRFYLSENAASDVVALVQHLGLRNYVLRGDSFGTSVATRAAYELERLGNPPGKLILSGTLGRYYDRPYESVADDKWRRTLALLPAEVRQAFTSNPLPMGFNDVQWGDFLATELFYSYPRKLASELSAILSPDPKVREGLRQHLAYLPPLPSRNPNLDKTPRGELIRTVLCTELLKNPDDYGIWGSPRLQDGQVIFVGKPGTCRNHPFTRPYDAKNYPLTSPIVYLEGAEDAHTPAWQSSYHFNSQTQAARVMVSVADEYHLPMQQEFGRRCGAQVMKAILETPRSGLAGAVRAAASKCPLKTTVRSEPGQVQKAWPMEMESSGPAQGDTGELR